jgi:glycosyltransferase involved in cell wall biosynthesis
MLSNNTVIFHLFKTIHPHIPFVKLYTGCMKIALVHELLTMRGGAEKLLKTVADAFPEAPIYTLLYDEKRMGDWFPRERVRTSSAQKYAFLSTNHHLYLNKFPKAVEQWNFADFDIVISFSSAFAHGVITGGRTKHLCYVNSPARYLWDRTFDVLSRAEQGVLGRWKRKHLEKTFHRLREWDAYAGERPDVILSASKAVQRRVELYWRRESCVLYPPVDVQSFPLQEAPREEYYVIASSLVPYKNIEIAIFACNALGKQLKIAGAGPHLQALQKIAGPTIEFLGYVEQRNLVELFQRARGFIFPGEEDFGIAPLEAAATGTPVIAYRAGGALETVEEGITGLFFDEPNAQSLQQAILTFEEKSFAPAACRARAEQFAQEKFLDGLKKAVMNVSL